MQKRRKGRKLNRKTKQRRALLHSLASALLLKEKIQSTEAKAREAAIFVEKQISRAKKGDMASKRVMAKYFTPRIVKKIINELAPRYKERNGGCTRIIKLGLRKTDGAKMAIAELLK